MRILVCTLALLMSALAPSASASGAPGKTPCSLGNATATTIEAVQADYRKWAGRCVRMRGIAVGIRLFADRFAFLERDPAYGGEPRRSIVLYGRDAPSGPNKPALVEVAGTIGSCEDQNAAVEREMLANPDLLIMVSGYCHTSVENYVQPSDIRILSRAPVLRLTEAEVPPGRRELVAPPAGMPGQAEAVAAARAMATAMATNDEPAFRRLSHPDIAAELDKTGDGAAPDWLHRDILEAHSEFEKAADLRRSFAASFAPGGWPERVFVNRYYLEGDAGEDEAPAFVVCWCKAADCVGRWPVSERDADNAPERPYLCARTGIYILGEGRAIQVDVEARDGGLVEPLWVASVTKRSGKQ